MLLREKKARAEWDSAEGPRRRKVESWSALDYARDAARARRRREAEDAAAERWQREQAARRQRWAAELPGASPGPWAREVGA